jgi:hypothetical protein
MALATDEATSRATPVAVKTNAPVREILLSVCPTEANLLARIATQVKGVLSIIFERVVLSWTWPHRVAVLRIELDHDLVNWCAVC